MLGKDTLQKMSDKQNKVRSFLNTISQLESSGGKNTNHAMMESGIHKGQTAIGRYGMMPNTVNEVLVRMKRKGMTSPELQELEGLDPDSLKENLEANPELENQIAEVLADKVLNRQQDEGKAAYTWFQGHNMTPEKIDTLPYKEHEYVKRYNAIKKMTNDEESNDER